MFFYTPDWTDGTVRRFVRRVGGHEALDELFALRAGDVAGRGFGEDPEDELGELRTRVATVAAEDAALKVTDLAIDGERRDAHPRHRRPAADRRRGAREAARARASTIPSLNEREKLAALVPEVANELKKPKTD